MPKTVTTPTLSFHECAPPSPAQRAAGGAALTKTRQWRKLAGIRPPAETSYASLSDKELIRRFRAGDRPAGDAFAERYQKRLKRFQRRRCRSADAAEDLVQDAFLRFFRYAARHSFEADGEKSVVNSLYAMAVCAAADAARQERKERRLMENLSLFTPRQPRSADAAAMAEEAGRQVDAAMAKLPPAEQEAAIWHFVDGLSTAEIKERTGVPQEVLRKRISRARKSLRSQLAEYWYGRRQ